MPSKSELMTSTLLLSICYTLLLTGLTQYSSINYIALGMFSESVINHILLEFLFTNTAIFIVLFVIYFCLLLILTLAVLIILLIAIPLFSSMPLLLQHFNASQTLKALANKVNSLYT